MFLYIVMSLIGIGIILYLYNYLEKRRKIIRRLKMLGVPPEKIKGRLSHLNTLLFDKEIELSEESFIQSKW